MKYQSFSKRQLLAMTWWNRPGLKEREGILCDGAIRSGKTISMVTGFFLWSMANFDGCCFALCGKTIGALRRNIVIHIPQWLGEVLTVRESRSDNKLTVTDRAGRTNTYYLFGGEDESSYKVIQGITLAGVLLDEAALMPRSFVEQAVARCSVTGSRIWLNCNPEGPQHWLYREWILKAEERKTLYLHFTMEDNPALSPRIRARYRRAYSGVFYRRFVLGEWTAAQGLVYDFFDREQDAAEVPEGGFDAWRISVDYGTANPASFGLWGRQGERWYRVKEYYYDSRKEGRQKTDAEYAEDLAALAGERNIERIIVDPSAASFIEALRRKGFRVKKADNDVADGIRVTADLLRQRKIVICRTCGDCLREMELYCWEERGDRDTPRKEHDHAMDEMRYFAMDLAGEDGGGFAAVCVERRTNEEAFWK